MPSTTDMTDEQWEQIAPMLPVQRRGRPRADDRQTIDGILYMREHECRWRDLPARYGDHVTCWRRLRTWTAGGLWERILSVVDDL
jgi:transposase